MRVSVSVLLVTLLLILACGGLGSSSPSSEPTPNPEVTSTKSTPQPQATGAQNTAAADAALEAAIESATDEKVKAYLRDCARVFPAVETGGYGEGMDNECTFVEFDQNCAPDRFGCWDKSQACINECGDPCLSCQSDCAGQCEDCKKECGTDVECLRVCGVTRSACRSQCIDGLNTCKGETCPRVEADCFAEMETERRKVCPNCRDFESCMVKVWFQQEGTERDCKKAAGFTDGRCAAWCSPDP